MTGVTFVPTLRALAPERRAHTAIVYRDRAYTGEWLHAESDALADTLGRLGAGPSTRLAISFANTPLFVVSLIAGMKLGASSLLLNPQFAAREMAEALRRTGATLLLARFGAAAALPMVNAEPIETLANLADAGGALSIWRADVAASPAAPGELTIQFTSGVSGRSKIVPRTADHLAYELDTFAATLSAEDLSTTVCPAPLFHAYGLVNGCLLPLFTGAPAILADWFLPNDVVDLVARYRPRMLIGVPAMYKVLADAFGAAPSALSSLRVCFSAGAPITAPIVDAFRARYGLDIHQQYGSTETGVIAINLLDRPGANPLAAGRAVSGREILLVDEHGSPTSEGAVGDILVRSGATTAGYLDDADLSSRALRFGGYLTGDTGRFDERGDLVIHGRRTAFINVAGQKVDPAEVEDVLTGCDAVAECAVVPVPDAISGELVKAIVVARRQTTAHELQRYCKARLAAFKVPRHVVFVDALPRSATGKVLTKYLIEA